jgi:hypothetical protein
MILMSIGFVNFRIVQIYLFWIIFQNDYLNFIRIFTNTGTSAPWGMIT